MSTANPPHYADLVLDDLGQGRVLVETRCPQCGEFRYPPRALCVNDLTPMEKVAVSPRGTLVEAVWVERPPYGQPEPFWVGYIDMPEGTRIFAKLDPRGAELVRGMPMDHEIGIVRTEPEDVDGPIFFPADGA
jgi:uncharacterized OB-fold protein